MIEVTRRGTPPHAGPWRATCPNCRSELRADAREDLKFVMRSRPLIPGVRTVDHAGREVLDHSEAALGGCPVCGLHAVDFEPADGGDKP